MTNPIPAAALLPEHAVRLAILSVLGYEPYATNGTTQKIIDRARTLASTAQADSVDELTRLRAEVERLRAQVATEYVRGREHEQSAKLVADHSFKDDNDRLRAEVQRLRAQIASIPQGEVTITTNRDGDCVLVSRQDDEHRILSVIWEAPTPGQRAEIRAQHDALDVATGRQPPQDEGAQGGREPDAYQIRQRKSGGSREWGPWEARSHYGCLMAKRMIAEGNDNIEIRALWATPDGMVCVPRRRYETLMACVRDWSAAIEVGATNGETYKHCGDIVLKLLAAPHADTKEKT